MNGKTLAASVLAATMTFGAVAPALADGAASTRNIIIGGAAAAVLVTNYNHKVRQKREEQREASRRQASYRSYFYRQHGYYPSDAQVQAWYNARYGH
jgi:hypothetical protein